MLNAQKFNETTLHPWGELRYLLN